jgi:hypothetical protein
VTSRARSVVIVLAIVAVAVAPSLARAQQRQRIPTYVELRGDGIFADSRITTLAGGGVVVPAGNYTRVSLDTELGAEMRSAETRFAGRVDVVARFLLDPLREMPWGISLGGGLTVPYGDGVQGAQPLMTAVIDVEGRRGRRFTPALQVGLGGGTRVALMFRASSRSWR